jgi:acyl dehydratase
MTLTAPAAQVAGPYFEELERGHVERSAPAVTITDGHAAMHQAILGGRLRLALERPLARRVLGTDQLLAHPSLVCDLAIGQSTVLTGRVIANLFYHQLAFRRAPMIGDTLYTTTEVTALKKNRLRPDRPATGLAVLRITTVDQHERPVLDFTRCAMLPLRDPHANTGAADELGDDLPAPDADTLAGAVAEWDLAELRTPGFGDADLTPGTVSHVETGDVVSSAPELARLSLNVAAAHHDYRAGQQGQRLVYGGHTIGLAAAQLTRALPSLATIVAWHCCDHLAPVHEGDTLTSTIELEHRDSLTNGGNLLHLRTRVHAYRGHGDRQDPIAVLDWRLAAVHP